MIDIHRYQCTSNKSNSNHIDLTEDDRVIRNKCKSSSTEANRKPSMAIYTDLQAPYASEEDQSDNSEDIITSNDHRNKSNSLKDRSQRSLTKKSSTNVTKSVQNHENPSNALEQRDSRICIRDRKDSVAKHTIGYDYDNDSTVDGLYTRIGIGSELNNK